VTNRRRPEMRCDMKDMNDMRIGNRIEELSLNHWPALVTMARGGWLLRFADGYTKRANSVSAIYGEEGGEEELEERIAWCERRFAELGVPAVFKMTPFDRPAGLDGLLDKRGYEKKDTTSVRTVELAGLPEPDRRDVRISERLPEEWLDHFCRMSGAAASLQPTMGRMLENIRAKKGFAVVLHEGKVAACGLGVAEDGWIGLYDIVTDAELRNRGFGERLVHGLLHWGKENGASRAYLAVVADNAPALRLYGKFGFAEVYRYWYRIKPDQ